MKRLFLISCILHGFLAAPVTEASARYSLSSQSSFPLDQDLVKRILEKAAAIFSTPKEQLYLEYCRGCCSIEEIKPGVYAVKYGGALALILLDILN